jgi:hypothetical protein
MIDGIPAALRARTRIRAGRRCEYCLLHEDDAWESHEPAHIIARKHRGLTEESNLAWTCFVCNRHKGSDIASIDEETQEVSRLFHPRRDTWSRHFRLDGGRISPRTKVGRVTVFLLQLNRPDRVQVREILYHKGLYPR